MLYWYWHPLFFIQFTKLEKSYLVLKLLFNWQMDVKISNIYVIEAQAKLKHTTYEKGSKIR